MDNAVVRAALLAMGRAFACVPAMAERARRAARCAPGATSDEVAVDAIALD